LPHPYFPLKKYNIQEGGRLHITPTVDTFQAVYMPDYDCEFKGINICFTAYNIEDTYDVLVGSRYVLRNSSIKEMAEVRMLEVYEDVTAGTPIIIQFHNNSGTEKFLMWDVLMLVDVQTNSGAEMLTWSFDWKDPAQIVGEGDTCSLVIAQPNYVNLESNILSFSLEITDLLVQTRICTIDYVGGVISSDYVETDPNYQGQGFLARSNVIAITAITVFEKSIQIVFRNVGSTGTTNPHPIEMGITGSVQNKKV
jgi:hypothetical protein